MVNLTNQTDHPKNPHKTAYFFKQDEHSDYFESLLIENKIKYEKHIEEGVNYFIVSRSDENITRNLNYLCIGKFRKPFIPDRVFGYVLIVISILIIGMAITGAIVSNK
jgi:hypothetical protein